jgi:hypothetical protein
VRNFGRAPEPRRDSAAWAERIEAGPAIGMPGTFEGSLHDLFKTAR